MAFDATQPAAGTFCQSINGLLRDNFAGIQKGDHFTAATEPSYKEEGCPWYDTANNLFKLYNGTSWDTVMFKTVYDSGWFAIAQDTSYAKAHNFGTNTYLPIALVATDSSGTNQGQADISHDGVSFRGIKIRATDTNNIQVRVGNVVPWCWNGSAYVSATHARIILLSVA